ncbi:hypothetical protein AVEN_177575-1 [Araneus ventricosus]|uniref:Uncharacterized protein n=1 Tax=Araneus ventricosus TaxID=182803 RepID=A0A4Y2MLS5_ARAVE|nr:hypothetical protein AVEN_177575-1 [Araneus ventricosus]
MSCLLKRGEAEELRSQESCEFYPLAMQQATYKNWETHICLSNELLSAGGLPGFLPSETQVLSSFLELVYLPLYIETISNYYNYTKYK